jgi:hypothetical protein
MSDVAPCAVNWRVESHPVHIGLASTLFASVIPDTMLNMAGRFVFALFTAVAASLISRLVTDTFRKK